MSSHDFSDELHKRLATEDAREQAIQDAIDQRKQLEEAKVAREQEERQQDLLREAEVLFAPETWRELLVESRYDSYHKRPILRCSFLESTLYLHKTPKADTWEILHQYGSTADKAIPPEQLEQKLLLQLARHQRSEAQRQQAIKEAEQKRLGEQAARLAVHTQLEARLISEQQRLLATLFVWPENLEEVPIYQIRYCKGGGWHGSKKTTVFEYEEAYTTADQLDLEGYIEIQEKDGPQVIKLDARIHKPVWRRLIVSKTTLSSLSSLYESAAAQHIVVFGTPFPPNLYESVEAKLPHVGLSYNQDDHRFYLTEDSRHYNLERIKVGIQPVLWLRQHILAQAALQKRQPEGSN